MTSPAADRPTTYVPTRDAREAVKGREAEILAALGIDWQRGRPHIDCVYPDHHGGNGGKNDWRWDAQQAKAYCTCSQGDDILSVLGKVEKLSFAAVKVRACEMIGRHDLVRQGGTRTDPASLMAPPPEQADGSLPAAYLAHRLGISADEVLMPSTAAMGWKALAYWDPPAAEGAKPAKAGDFPAVVFATAAADGRQHAHRIYVAHQGAGKAILGLTADGQPRNSKKAAKAPRDGRSTAGCSVLWGDPQQASHIILAEGIETAAAVALSFRSKVEAGEIAVAAAISAGGIAAWGPYPVTRRVTVAADRDESVEPPRTEPTRAGERAAQKFAARMRKDRPDDLDVDFALPGVAGEKVDWLDVLRADGVEAVRTGISAVAAFEQDRAGADAEVIPPLAGADDGSRLHRVAETYPVPVLHGRNLAYSLTRTGQVWLCQDVTRGKGAHAREERVPLASPFAVTARLRNVGEGNSYGLRLLMEDMDGQPRAVDIDRKLLAEMGGAAVRGLLLECGVRFEEDGETVAVAALKAANPTKEISIMRYPGWHDIDGTKIYVTPGGEVIGLQDSQPVELASAAVLAPSVARAGSLDGWKAAAAAAVAARGCPHFTLGLAAGFAGVLVDLCAFDSCGINLSGQTSAGKTTAQRLAASAWSVPDSRRPGLFQTAKTTVNGFEALAARANGSVFVLDELAHLSGREVAKVIYTLASGVGKTRMTTSAEVRETRRWRTFAILSSETGLEAKIRADGEPWTGGQAVRVVDVDVSDVNRLLDASVLSQVRSVSQHHGHAGPAFVRGLFATGAHQKGADIKEKIEQVALGLVGLKADSATTRAALPLAIIMAAGHMAQEFGLLPVGSAVNDAVLWAWRMFRGSNDALALDPTEQAIANIGTWVARRWNGSVVSIDSDDRAPPVVDGWYDADAVYLPPDKLVEAAGGTLKEALIARALKSAGLIAKAKDREHLYVKHIRKIGHVKAYALSRKTFGRGADEGPLQAQAQAW